MNTLVILKRKHNYDLSYFSDNVYPKRFSSTSLEIKHLNKKLSGLLSKYKIDRVLSNRSICGIESSGIPVYSVEDKLREVYHDQFVNAVLCDVTLLNPQYKQDVRVSSGAKPDNILRLSQIIIGLIDNSLPVLPKNIEEVVSIDAPLNFASISNAIFELTTYNLPTFFWLLWLCTNQNKLNFNKNIEKVYKAILDYFGSEARALSVIRYWLGTGYSVNEFLQYTEIVIQNVEPNFIASTIKDVVLPETVNDDMSEFIPIYIKNKLYFYNSTEFSISSSGLKGKVSSLPTGASSFVHGLQGCDSVPDTPTPALFNIRDLTGGKVDPHTPPKKY